MTKRNPMMCKSNFFRLLVFFIAIHFFSCSAPKKLRENQFGSNEFYFQPLVNILHQDNDTTILLLEFDADQLLYSRKSTYENFNAQLEVAIIIKKQQSKTDTLRFNFSPPQMQESGVWREEIPLPISFGNYELLVELKDLNRRAQSEKKFSFLKNEQPSTFDARVTANSADEPIYSQYLVTGDTIHLDFPRFQNSEYPPAEIFALTEIPNLPPPAFSNNSTFIRTEIFHILQR